MRGPIILTLTLGVLLASTATAVAAPRIVGGSIAPAGSWPSIVALESRAGGQFCGGTLIAPQWVLTAGHCRIYDPPQMRAVIGRQDLDDEDGEMREISALVRHPDYRMAYPGAPRNDIMLVRLQAPSAAPTMAVAPERAGLAVGAPLTVAGWGSTSYVARTDTFGPGSIRLRQTAVRNLADSRCRDPYGPAFVADLMVCAAERGRDACAGDSGGPLVEIAEGAPRQVGIVSWGTGCALRGYPGVYTRVSRYTCWISTTINPPRPVDAIAASADADGAQVRWSWSPGCASGAGVRGFRVNVEPGGQVLEVRGGERVVRVRGYTPGTQLAISVTPLNRSGEGPPVAAAVTTAAPPVRITEPAWTGFGRARLSARLERRPDRPLRVRAEWGRGLALQQVGPWIEVPAGAGETTVPLELTDLSPAQWYVRVAVEGADDASAGASAIAELPAPQPPRATVRPRIRGDVRVGGTVRCVPGSWRGTRPITLRVRWTRDDLPIAGASAIRYRIEGADRGRGLRCRVVASGPGGVRTASSAAVRPS